MLAAPSPPFFVALFSESAAFPAAAWGKTPLSPHCRRLIGFSSLPGPAAPAAPAAPDGWRTAGAE